MLYRIRDYYKYLRRIDIFNRHMAVENHGFMDIKKQIQGANNKFIVGCNTRLDGVEVIVQGSNNIIEFGCKCYVGRDSKILVQGNNMMIKVGNGTRFAHDDELTCQEDNSTIIIGDNCGISHHVNVRTSDSHEIIDLKTNERINPAKSVKIGEHVWIAPHSIIMKGVTIGDGAIIGTRSVVTRDVPSFSLAVGMPATVKKSNVTRREAYLF